MEQNTKLIVTVCDRCHRMKIRCTKTIPCDRCLRFGLSCKYTRKPGKLGRPKANKDPVCQPSFSKSDMHIQHIHTLDSYCDIPSSQKIDGRSSLDISSSAEPKLNSIDIKDSTESTLQANGESLVIRKAHDFSESSGSNLYQKLASIQGSDGIEFGLEKKISKEKTFTSLSIHMNSEYCNGMSQEDISNEKRLIDHFQFHVSYLIFTKNQRRFFLDKLIPICNSSALVKLPILAISERHIDYLQKLKYLSENPALSKDLNLTEKSNYSFQLEGLIYNGLIQLSLRTTEEGVCFLLCMVILDLLEGSPKNRESYVNIFLDWLTTNESYLDYIEANPLYVEFISYIYSVVMFSKSNPFSLNEEITATSNLKLSSCILSLRKQLENGGTYFEWKHSKLITDISRLYGLKENLACLKQSIMSQLLDTCGEVFLSSLSEHRILEKKFNELCAKLELYIIQELEPYFACDPNLLGNDGKDLNGYVLLFSSYIRLHQLIYGSTEKQCPRVQQSLRCLLEILCAIRVQSISHTLCLPLVLAASVAISNKDRIIIEEFMNRMKEKYSFGYIFKTIDLIKRIWQDDDVVTHILNWENIYHNEFPELIFF